MEHRSACARPLLVVLWLGAARERSPPRTAATAATAPPRALPTLRFLTLAAAPSALLLGVTRYLTTDVASVPLLWIVPLALYLATFIHAFAGRELIPHRRLPPLIAIGLLVLAVSYPFTHGKVEIGLVHLVVFTACALYCHGALADARPPASDLTRFYLLVSTGGLIGGLLVALVAPLVFNDIHEYPIAIAAVAVLLPATPMLIGRAHRVACVSGLVLIVAGSAMALGVNGNETEASPIHRAGTYLYLAGAAVVAILAARAFLAHPAWLGAVVAITFFAPGLSGRDTIEIARERTFFGVYRVEEADGVRSLYHGTTLHGAEWRRPDRTIESHTAYFAEGSPYADILHALHRRGSPMVIGIAGLGTGSLACYAHAGDTVRIYEIDPAMVELARTHFAALGTCAPDATIVIGDARLALEAETATFDVLALDAFSSDAIPVHMLTEQALRSYLRVLAPHGVIAVHISNRYLNLEPLLAALTERLGLAARIKHHMPDDENEPPRLALPTTLVGIARNEAVLGGLELDAGWRPLESDERVHVWTDDYASIVPLLR